MSSKIILEADIAKCSFAKHLEKLFLCPEVLLWSFKEIMISFLFKLFNEGIQCKSNVFIKIYADGLLCIIH